MVPSKLATRSETSGTAPPQCSHTTATGSPSSTSSSEPLPSSRSFRFFFFFDGGFDSPSECSDDSRAAKKAAVAGSSNTDSYADYAENDAACVATMAQSVAWTSFAVRSPPRKLSERLMERGIRANYPRTTPLVVPGHRTCNTQPS